MLPRHGQPGLSSGPKVQGPLPVLPTKPARRSGSRCTAPSPRRQRLPRGQTRGVGRAPYVQHGARRPPSSALPAATDPAPTRCRSRQGLRAQLEEPARTEGPAAACCRQPEASLPRTSGRSLTRLGSKPTAWRPHPAGHGRRLEQGAELGPNSGPETAPLRVPRTRQEAPQRHRRSEGRHDYPEVGWGGAPAPEAAGSNRASRGSHGILGNVVWLREAGGKTEQLYDFL